MMACRVSAIDRHRRGILIGVMAVTAALFVALFLLLSFGWGLLRGTVERRLSASTGRQVRIASIARVGRVSFSPVLELRGVRVAQPAWAGTGDMLRIASARIRLPVVPLLVGHVDPEAISMTGLRLALVRDAQGRANWERDQHEAPSGAGSPDLGHMTLSDGAISLDDAQRERRFRVRVAIDGRGLRAVGTGSIAGNPATLRLSGPSVAEQREWPFDLHVESAIVSMHLAARAARPLDVGHFRGRIEARGRNLLDLDRLIDAGLFASQPFRLAATIEHDRPAWKITRLTGTIGRSDVAGDISVHRRDDRTLIDGGILSSGFDFDDLASNKGLAQSAADLRRTGPRLFPATRIDLSRLRKLDGTLRFTLRRLLFKVPSSVKSLRGTATLDHGVLTVSPLMAGLEHGRVTGSAIVRHASGRPRLTLDLTLTGSRLEGLVTTPDIATGPLDGRLRLTGVGMTVREALGRSSGTVGMVSSGGVLNRRAALAMGSDIGRALFEGKAESTPMRCMVGRFDVAGGLARPDPLIIDTAVAQGEGSGIARLSDERLAMAVRGRPKLTGGLRFEGAIEVGGTIKLPHITPPPGAVTAGGILKAIGAAIAGDKVPLAGDADCAGLAARALR